MENQTIINLFLIVIAGAAFYKSFFHSIDRSELTRTIIDSLCYVRKTISQNQKGSEDGKEKSNHSSGSNKTSGIVDSEKSGIN